MITFWTELIAANHNISRKSSSKIAYPLNIPCNFCHELLGFPNKRIQFMAVAVNQSNLAATVSSSETRGLVPWLDDGYNIPVSIRDQFDGALTATASLQDEMQS